MGPRLFESIFNPFTSFDKIGCNCVEILYLSISLFVFFDKDFMLFIDLSNFVQKFTLIFCDFNFMLFELPEEYCLTFIEFL